MSLPVFTGGSDILGELFQGAMRRNANGRGAFG
jgi:hypothetical protein